MKMYTYPTMKCPCGFHGEMGGHDKDAGWLCPTCYEIKQHADNGTATPATTCATAYPEDLLHHGVDSPVERVRRGTETQAKDVEDQVVVGSRVMHASKGRKKHNPDTVLDSQRPLELHA